MKKLLCCLCVSGMCLGFPLAASAKQLDMKNYTCGDLTSLTDPTDVAMIYMWLDGYVSAKTNNLVIDMESVEGDLQDVMDECKGKDNEKLLEVLGH
ncbi:hypothetical protein LJC46_03935 [Desulfovibrio sp. OttesenSCG-928-G15]|nr:hypothetical protein [Desulfovibrio sp. OttesenSCG-928-G15]